MRTWKTIALLLLAFGPASADSPRSAPPPGARPIHRALLISVDGLRPDVLLRAKAPVLRDLMKRGSFTLWAVTTPAAVTLPSHTSMLTGVSPAKHGIDWNSDLPLAHPVYPAWPTLFELARKAGLTTAMTAGKSKFSVLAKPGTLDWSFVPPTGPQSDSTVADTAVAWIRRHSPQVLFVHLPGVDVAGHARGWGSHEQLAAVAAADRCVGRLLAALRSRRLRDATVILVTADHGGTGNGHGPDDPRSRYIPWIISGPGIRADFDLTTIADLNVRTEDTFATICYLLEIPVPEPIDGRPVMEILDDSPGR